jgi:hypothetical protein
MKLQFIDTLKNKERKQLEKTVYKDTMNWEENLWSTVCTEDITDKKIIFIGN